jgi:hypothetical protein
MSRLSIDISDEKSLALDQILEHGMRVIVFNLLIDDLLRTCKEYGAGKVIGALIDRAITIKEISKLNLKESKL